MFYGATDDDQCSKCKMFERCFCERTDKQLIKELERRGYSIIAKKDMVKIVDAGTKVVYRTRKEWK